MVIAPSSEYDLAPVLVRAISKSVAQCAESTAAMAMAQDVKSQPPATKAFGRYRMPVATKPLKTILYVCRALSFWVRWPSMMLGTLVASR